MRRRILPHDGALALNEIGRGVTRTAFSGTCAFSSDSIAYSWFLNQGRLFIGPAFVFRQRTAATANPATATPVDFLWKITGGSCPLAAPQGLGPDQQGNVYAVDGGNSRIQKFDSNGKFLPGWGSRGEADRQSTFPDDLASVAVDAQGNVYVSDDVKNSIQRFRLPWSMTTSGDRECRKKLTV